MPPSKLGVFAHLALAASAVLIPSTMSAEDLAGDNALETLATSPFKRTVVLECRDCDYVTVEDDGAQIWNAHAGSAYVS